MFSLSNLENRGCECCSRIHRVCLLILCSHTAPRRLGGHNLQPLPAWTCIYSLLLPYHAAIWEIYIQLKTFWGLKHFLYFFKKKKHSQKNKVSLLRALLTQPHIMKSITINPLSKNMSDVLVIQCTATCKGLFCVLGSDQVPYRLPILPTCLPVPHQDVAPKHLWGEVSLSLQH